VPPHALSGSAAPTSRAAATNRLSFMPAADRRNSPPPIARTTAKSWAHLVAASHGRNGGLWWRDC